MKERELIIWEEKNKVNAEIRLSHSDKDDLYKFRDSLSEQIKNNRNFEILKDEGFPTEFDSNFILVDKGVFNDTNQKIRILRNQTPKPIKPYGFFDFLFRTKKYKQNSEIYKRRGEIETKVWEIVNPLAQVIIQTTHDYPYLDCCSKVHKKSEFIEEIKNIAEGLDIQLNIVNKKFR
jgi:hypothetical protein